MKSDEYPYEDRRLKKKKGRPRSLSEAQINKIAELYYYTPISIRKIATVVGSSKSAIERAIKAGFYEGDAYGPK